MLVVSVGLALGILLLLAMPFDIAFRLNTEQSVRPRVTLGWAFGLLTKQLDSLPQQASPVKPAVRGVRSVTAVHRNGKTVMTFLRSPGMPARLYQLACRLGRQLHIRQFRLQLRVGLDDPADTGRLYGALGPALMRIRHCHALDLQFLPVFTESTLTIDSHGQIRVFPLALVGVLIGFMLSPVCWRALIAAARSQSRD